jgi:anti-sigma B factor antagonist
LQINIEQKADICIIKCIGNIDSDAYSGLKEVFDKLMREKKYKIVVDLSDVNFISSTGWGIFIGSLQKIRSGGGDLRLAAMTEEVENIYNMVNFGELLLSYDTIEEAIDSFK